MLPGPFGPLQGDHVGAPRELRQPSGLHAEYLTLERALFGLEAEGPPFGLFPLSIPLGMYSGQGMSLLAQHE